MRKTALRAISGVSAFLAVSSPTLAASGNVVFNGSITSTCLMVVSPTGGTLAANGALTSLSSKNAGGAPGLVTVTSTGGVSFSVDPTVTTNIRPTADGGTIDWVPSYSAVGDQTILETVLDTVLSVAGTSAISVNLEGTKNGGGTFAAGAYRATVTVTCE